MAENVIEVRVYEGSAPSGSSNDVNPKKKGKNKIKPKTFGDYFQALGNARMAQKAFNLASTANSILGDVTENRQRERETAVTLQFAGYAMGFAVNPALGAVYTGVDLVLQGAKYRNNIYKKELTARKNRQLAGRTTLMGGKYRGVGI